MKLHRFRNVTSFCDIRSLSDFLIYQLKYTPVSFLSAYALALATNDRVTGAGAIWIASTLVFSIVETIAYVSRRRACKTGQRAR